MALPLPPGPMSRNTERPSGRQPAARLSSTMSGKRSQLAQWRVMNSTWGSDSLLSFHTVNFIGGKNMLPPQFVCLHAYTRPSMEHASLTVGHRVL